MPVKYFIPALKLPYAFVAALLLISLQGICSDTSLLPTQYPGSIDLITNGRTVVRAINYRKGTIYASVDAETCYPNQAANAATVFAVDVTNPSAMRYLTKGSIGGCKANGLMAYDDRLYIANWSTLLTTFDICNRSNINPLGNFHIPTNASWTINVKGDRVYLGEAHELYESFYIIDVANRVSPRLVSITPWAGGPAVAGPYSYYGDFTWLKVLNISDETAPAIISGVDLGVNVGDPVFHGKHVFASWNFGQPGNGTSGIVCVDISDPIAP